MGFDVAICWQECIADCYHGYLSATEASSLLPAVTGSWLVHRVYDYPNQVVIRVVLPPRRPPRPPWLPTFAEADEEAVIGAVTLNRLDNSGQFTLLRISPEFGWDEETIKKVQERGGGIAWWICKKGLPRRGVVLKTRIG